MKSTITTLFIIAMLISSTQSLRHVYIKWINPTDSVLDEFKDKTYIKIESSKTMEELVVLYRVAKKKVDIYEDDKKNPEVKARHKYETEPYKSERSIRSEISSRELDYKRLFKLKFYWFAGLSSLIIGVVIFLKFNAWLGLSSVIIGISEMLCWTSPLFYNRNFSHQFESLLNHKLTLSLITWLIIVILWLLIDNNKLPRKKGN